MGHWLRLLALVAMTGCLSLREQIAQQERWVTSGNYKKAYQDAVALANDAGGAGADTNYWNADAGTLALLCKDWQGALHHLDTADNGFNDEARRVIGAGVVSHGVAIATNDGVMNYAPEGVDRVFVNLYKAIAYGKVGNLRAMRVELNRVRQRQNEWFYFCTKDIAKQALQLAAQSKEERQITQQTLQNVSTTAVELVSTRVAQEVALEQPSAIHFFERLRGFGNAYASHLTGITRWCAGDSSRNDLAMAAALAPENRFVVKDCVDAERKEPTNRIWVYVEDGLAPKRVSKSMTVSYPSIGSRGLGISTMSFDMPELKRRMSAALGYRVNGVPLEPLADIETLVEDQFNRAKTGILVRQIARTVSRVIAQEVTQAVLYQQDKNGFLPLLASLLFIFYDVSTTAADLRCADLLPKTVWMGALERPVNGRVTITPQGLEGMTVTLTSTGNALLWVRKPSRQAPATLIEIELDHH